MILNIVLMKKIKEKIFGNENVGGMLEYEDILNSLIPLALPKSSFLLLCTDVY